MKHIHAHLLAIATSVIGVVFAAPIATIYVSVAQIDTTEMEATCNSLPRSVAKHANTHEYINTNHGIPGIAENRNGNEISVSSQNPSNVFTKRSCRCPYRPWNWEDPPVHSEPYDCMDFMDEIVFKSPYTSWPDPSYDHKPPINSSAPSDPLINTNVPRPYPVSNCSDCNRYKQREQEKWEKTWVYRFAKKWGGKLGEWLGLGREYEVEGIDEEAWVWPTDREWSYYRYETEQAEKRYMEQKEKNDAMGCDDGCTGSNAATAGT